MWEVKWVEIGVNRGRGKEKGEPYQLERQRDKQIKICHRNERYI